MKNLVEVYQECFPERDADVELEFLTNNTKMLKIEKNGNLIAFLFYKIISEDEAEILDLGTSAQFRNQGYAKKLIIELSNILKEFGIKKIYLEVSENNQKAKNLYKNQLFIDLSVRKNYYHKQGKTENALVMCKNL